jgi:hypothetical protein
MKVSLKDAVVNRAAGAADACNKPDRGVLPGMKRKTGGVADGSAIPKDTPKPHAEAGRKAITLPADGSAIPKDTPKPLVVAGRRGIMPQADGSATPRDTPKPLAKVGAKSLTKKDIAACPEAAEAVRGDTDARAPGWRMSRAERVVMGACAARMKAVILVPARPADVRAGGEAKMHTEARVEAECGMKARMRNMNTAAAALVKAGATKMKKIRFFTSY